MCQIEELPDLLLSLFQYPGPDMDVLFIFRFIGADLSPSDFCLSRLRQIGSIRAVQLLFSLTLHLIVLKLSPPFQMDSAAILQITDLLWACLLSSPI